MNKNRYAEMVSFICGNYCQHCKTKGCNVGRIMGKYENSWLTPSQMKEVNKFELENISCKNHTPDEGFLMFAHKIEVHYTDGRVERKNGWYSSKAISEIWDDSVEYVDILFSDV